jgi:hypothetical protein
MRRASYDQRIAQRTAKRRSTARLPFARALRKLGFKRTDPDRDPLIYEQSRGVMKVTVQLWLEGSIARPAASTGITTRCPPTSPRWRR